MVQLWQTERSKAHLDLTFKVLMEEKKKKKCSREWPVKQLTGSGKAAVTHSTETQHSFTSGKSTDRWRATLRTPAPPPPPPRPPDLVDANGAVLRTSKEKGSAILQRFVQQTNQHKYDERKGLDRTPTEAG